MGEQIQSSPVQWLLVAQMVTLGIRTVRHWRRGTDEWKVSRLRPGPGMVMVRSQESSDGTGTFSLLDLWR